MQHVQTLIDIEHKHKIIPDIKVRIMKEKTMTICMVFSICNLSWIGKMININVRNLLLLHLSSIRKISAVAKL